MNEQVIRKLTDTLEDILTQHPAWTTSDAGRELLGQCRALRGKALSNAEALRVSHELTTTLRHIVIAHHEAGHVLAYLHLTPRNRIHLDDVRFTPDEETGGITASTTYTFVTEPQWPNPDDRNEIIRELACLLAGKAAEPHLISGVRIDGTDLDDQNAVLEFTELLESPQREAALVEANELLATLDLVTRAPPLAAYLYDQWRSGHGVTTSGEIAVLFAEKGK